MTDQPSAADLKAQGRALIREAALVAGTWVPAGPDAIDRMAEVFPWLGWLAPEDAKLVWARAEGTPWKGICWRFGISRATANRRWQYGLAVIVWRLNGRRVPRKRSASFVIDGVR